MAGTGARVIVVGSGPSSATAAKLLVERGLEVVMLESGTTVPQGLVVRAGGNVLYRRLPNRHIRRRSVSLNEDPVDWWQSLDPGGLTNHWTSAVPRFAPRDFDEGGTLDPALVWPVGYHDLEHYYDLAEQTLTVTAGNETFPQLPRGVAAYRRGLPDDWRPIAGAAADLGHGLTVMPAAVGKRWMIARRGTEFNSYHDIVRPLLEWPNFEYRRGAHVLEVLPTDPRRGGPGVRVRTGDDGDSDELWGAAVVLGAGAMATTRLLMTSRSTDAPDGLGNSRDVLGRYLHDHPKSWWPCQLSQRVTLPSHTHYMTRGPYDGAEPLTGTSWTIGLRRTLDRTKTWARAPGRELGVQVFGTMLPTLDSRVHLRDERDERGDRRIGVEIDYDDLRSDVVLRAHEPLRAVFERAGIDMEVAGVIEIGTPGSSVHFGGSVRMHDDPACGVLDRWNRLHDMPEIVVCDKSCFTTGPEKNPTLTAMALAARAADHLADELAA